MDEFTKPQLRSISVGVYGDSADELEMHALDKAREFFGTDVALHIVRDYQVTAPPKIDTNPNVGNKRWYAYLKVEADS